MSARSPGAPKQQLYAHAAALLMRVRWREPFGMVMVEALACGTPVIAFRQGAAAEIVLDGENGMLVADEAEMAGAVERLASIDPKRCRASVAERYDASVTVAGYEHVYRRAIAAYRQQPPLARYSAPCRTVTNFRKHRAGRELMQTAPPRRGPTTSTYTARGIVSWRVHWRCCRAIGPAR